MPVSIINQCSLVRQEFFISLFNGSSLSNFPKREIKIKVKNSILFLFFPPYLIQSFVKIKLLYCIIKVFLTTLMPRHHSNNFCWSVYPKFNKIPHTLNIGFVMCCIYNVQACLNWSFKESLKKK